MPHGGAPAPCRGQGGATELSPEAARDVTRWQAGCCPPRGLCCPAQPGAGGFCSLNWWRQGWGDGARRSSIPHTPALLPGLSSLRRAPHSPGPAGGPSGPTACLNGTYCTAMELRLSSLELAGGAHLLSHTEPLLLRHLMSASQTRWGAKNLGADSTLLSSFPVRGRLWSPSV